MPETAEIIWLAIAGIITLLFGVNAYFLKRTMTTTDGHGVSIKGLEQNSVTKGEVDQLEGDINHIKQTYVTKDEMKEIVTLQSKTLVERCKTELNILLTITSPAKEWLVNKSYDRKFGARPLKRMIQTKIEDQLAEEILTGKVKAGTKVTVSVKNEELVFKSENSIKQ